MEILDHKITKVPSYIKEVICDELEVYEGTTLAVDELLYDMFSTWFVYGDNAFHWIEEHSNELLYIIYDIQHNYSGGHMSYILSNLKDNPCQFFVAISEYVGLKLLDNCECLNRYGAEPIHFTKEIISKILKELELQGD